MYHVTVWDPLPEVRFGVSQSNAVREIKTTPKETPGPGQYTKVALLHKLKAPTWV
jgi:hypothetical protein